MAQKRSNKAAKASKQMRKRLRDAARRRIRRAAGKCPHCGNDPAPGRVQCESCLESDRKSKRRIGMKKYWAYAKLGLCTKCGAEPVPGTRLCGRHSEMAADTQRKQTEKARKNGKCIQCKRRRPAVGRVRCKTCLEYARIHQALRRQGVRPAVDRRRRRAPDER